jgi:integrase/recombinase XerC
MEFNHFYSYLIAEKRSSAHTVESYKNDLQQFEQFCLREFEVSSSEEVTQSMVRTWLATLMDENYAVASVHRKLSSVNAYYRFLQKIGELENNPARNISKPKLPKRLPSFIDERGASNLYNTDLYTGVNRTPFSSQRDKVLMTLLYETGIRRAELIGLRDQDVDQYLQQIKVTGKRNKMRYIPVGKDMLEEIGTYIKLRDAEFGLSFESLLVNDKGKKISNSFVYSKVNFYLSQTSTLQKKSPHVLRHTFATHMLNNGAELNVIKEILGHSSLAATQVYTHNNIEKLKSIHQKMHPRNN